MEIPVMKKIYLFVALVAFSANLLSAQVNQHKIIFDFTEADSASFSTMVRHATNLMVMTGTARLEIVCHGPGVDLLLKGKTTVQKEIEELNSKYNVVFAACEATMKRKGVNKSQLLSSAITVPAAILELSTKQQEGWSYIKEGY
jgi:uncharacterized protein